MQRITLLDEIAQIWVITPEPHKHQKNANRSSNDRDVSDKRLRQEV